MEERRLRRKRCPYCGEMIEIGADPGGGAFQQYVENCQVCFNPWQVSVRFSDVAATVEISPLDS